MHLKRGDGRVFQASGTIVKEALGIRLSDLCEALSVNAALSGIKNCFGRGSVVDSTRALT